MYTPGSREIVYALILLWKSQPETEELGYTDLYIKLKEVKTADNWSFTEDQMKASLEEFNIPLKNQPEFTYVEKTISPDISKLKTPDGIKVVKTTGRGNALYTTKPFKKGDKIWSEVPLVSAAPIKNWKQIRGGNCCCYCGNQVRKSRVVCKECGCSWCSHACQKYDVKHALTTHKSPPQIDSKKWKLFEKFCAEKEWNACYLYGVILAHQIQNCEDTKFAEAFNGLAKIHQDYRQRAVSEPNSLESEQLEAMWERGFKLLSDATNGAQTKTHPEKLTYEEFMLGLGAVNLNNINGCVFEVHSKLNHSCDPNISVVFNEFSKAHGIDVFAAKDIDADTELLTTYVDPGMSVENRSATLRINYGFICECDRCVFEKTNGERVDTKSKSTKEVHFKKNEKIN